jgi:tRNA-Thr(GGU) m(6)t(6)A37 methyltransferase TsaA
MSEEVLTYAMRPIGFVRSPYREAAEIPKGPGAEHHAEGTIEVRPELEAGLQDVEGFSHLFVVWVFDRAGGAELVSDVPLDPGTPHGVFASRSPRRPNPIGLTVVELLGRDGTRLRVRGVDMLDGTPVLDIKPYLSGVAPENLRRGWVAAAERKRGVRS